MKKRVLFLCTGNSCRSQMAEGLVRNDFGEDVEPFSAGTDPEGLNRRAVKVMAEIGIDISRHSSDHIGRYEDQHFDYVITLCDDAIGSCPQMFCDVKVRHICFSDPPKAGADEEQILSIYRQLRDSLRQMLGDFFSEELRSSSGR